MYIFLFYFFMKIHLYFRVLMIFIILKEHIFLYSTFAFSESQY